MLGGKVITEEHADTAASYADGAERVMYELGIDRKTLDDGLLNFGVERCPHCHWYTECCHLTDDEGEVDGYCDNCRRYAP